MHAMSSIDHDPAASADELEMLALERKHVHYLAELARETNPAMPASLGIPHVIRMIIDRVEQSGIDLTHACSEEEISRIAASQLRQMTPDWCGALSTEPLFSSSSSAAQRSCRSNPPGRDRRRSGTTPRSGRG